MYSNELSEAMSRLIAQHPFYATYLYEMMTIKETTDIPTAATDGVTQYYNPDYMARQSIEKRVGVIKHETWHGILDHMGRTELYNKRGFGPDLKPFDPDVMNQAEDYIINDIIVTLEKGELPDGCLLDRSIANYNDIADEIYSKLNAQPKPPKGPGNGKPNGNNPQGSNGHGGFDNHLAPPSNKPSTAQQQRALSSALNAAKAQGHNVGHLERMLGDLLEPQITWIDKLRNLVTSRSGNDTHTWSRLNRRRLAVNPQIALPGRTGYQVGDIAVVIDTSGSISDKELRTFLSETAGLFAEVTPKSLHVMWTDYDVRHVDEVEYAEDLETLKAHGGGGTRMPAAFDYVQDNAMDIETMIILTDGYTDFGDEQPYEVVWVMTSDKVADHGSTIKINV